jgi:hypothetical protein
MAGKYTPLENYLLALPADRKEVRLFFDEIEEILKFKFGNSCDLAPDGGSRPPRAVPASAYEDQRWWEHETEGNHVNKRAWVNAGWKMESVDVKVKQVKLARAGQRRN